MTTTRATRATRRTQALAMLTMGTLLAVPLLPRPELAAASAKAVDVKASPDAKPHHHRGMMLPHHEGAKNTGTGGTGTTPDHASSDAGRGVDGRLEYFGGRVISNVKVYDIFWGSTIDPTYQAQIGGFYQAILNSPYWTWLAEYNSAGLSGATNNKPGSNQVIGAGSYASGIVITPQNQNLTISAGDVATELAYQMSTGVIPPLDLDAGGNVNSLYVFDFPGTMTITDSGSTSCKDFCAEHQTTQMMQGGVTYSVPYVIMPSQYAGPCKSIGCGVSGNSPLANTTIIASHELAESVTDPEVGLAFGLNAPIAWYDAVDQLGQQASGGEVGDLCNGIAGVAAGYAVQKLWSNLNNQCIEAAPLCNGSTQPPYCTPCAATDDGVGCLGATPVCETDATSAQVGQCVACTASTKCPNGAASFCDATHDTCRGCEPADCSGTAAVCETTGTQVGQCVQCDPSNTAACSGTTPLCNPGTFTCVGCVTNASCSFGTPICDVDSQQCRGCESAGDCTAGQVCDVTTGSAKVGQCLPCTKNAECDGNPSGDVCQAGACVTGTPDAGGGRVDAGAEDSGGGPSSTGAARDAGAGDAGAKGGSSGGCTVAGGKGGVGDGALAWLAALGVILTTRRRRFGSRR